MKQASAKSQRFSSNDHVGFTRTLKHDISRCGSSFYYGSQKFYPQYTWLGSQKVAYHSHPLFHAMAISAAMAFVHSEIPDLWKCLLTPVETLNIRMVSFVCAKSSCKTLREMQSHGTNNQSNNISPNMPLVNCDHCAPQSGLSEAREHNP